MARIDWRCDVCKEPVKNGTGYIEADTRTAQAYGRAYVDFEAKEHEKAKASGGWPRVDLEALWDLPDPGAWHVYHRACDPEPDYSGYWFAIERCRTQTQLLDWTAHLMEKNWLAWTTWDLFIRRPEVTAAAR